MEPPDRLQGSFGPSTRVMRGPWVASRRRRRNQKLGASHNLSRERPGHHARASCHTRPAPLCELPTRLRRSEAPPRSDHQTGRPGHQRLRRLHSAEPAGPGKAPAMMRKSWAQGRTPISCTIACRAPARGPPGSEGRPSPRRDGRTENWRSPLRAAVAAEKPQLRQPRTPGADPREDLRRQCLHGVEQKVVQSDFLGFPSRSPFAASVLQIWVRSRF